MSSCRASTAPASLQQAGQLLDVERRAVREDEPPVGGQAHAGTPHVVAAAQGRAPAADHVLVDRRGDLAVVDDQLEVLPHADDLRGHPHLAAPAADLDRAIAVVHHRGDPADQRSLGFAVQVEAAARGVQLEPAVEGGEQAGPAPGRDIGSGVQASGAGVFGPGVQLEGDQPLVHGGDSGHVRGIHRRRPQEGAEDGRLALDRFQHAPLALTRQRGAGRRVQLLGDDRLEGLGALVLGRARSATASEKDGLPPTWGGL